MRPWRAAAVEEAFLGKPQLRGLVALDAWVDRSLWPHRRLHRVVYGLWWWLLGARIIVLQFTGRVR